MNINDRPGNPTVGCSRMEHLRHYYPELFQRNGELKPVTTNGQGSAQEIVKQLFVLSNDWNRTPHEKGGAK